MCFYEEPGVVRFMEKENRMSVADHWRRKQWKAGVEWVQGFCWEKLKTYTAYDGHTTVSYTLLPQDCLLTDD